MAQRARVADGPRWGSPTVPVPCAAMWEGPPHTVAWSQCRPALLMVWCCRPGTLPLARRVTAANRNRLPFRGNSCPLILQLGRPYFSGRASLSQHRRGERKTLAVHLSLWFSHLPFPGLKGERQSRGEHGERTALSQSGDARFLAPSPWKQPGCSGMDLCGTSAARLMISSKLASCLCSCCLFHREFAFSFQMHRESRRRQRCAHVSFLLVQTPCVACMYKHMCIARSNNLHLPIRQGHAQILLFQVWVMDQRKPTPQNGQSKLYISLSSSLNSILKWGHNLTWLLRNYTINLSSC